MIKYFFLCVILFLVSACSLNKNFNDNNYEIICQNEGAEGTYLVKVFTYGSDEKKAISEAKHRAIHGVLFRGVTGSRCGEKPKICKVNYEDNKKFFDDFFNSGKYLQYVVISDDYGSIDRVKTSSGVKMGFVVSIKHKELRKYMESQGMANSMDSIF